MSKLDLNVGAAENDGTGDTGRAGGLKIKANFDELYAFLGGDTLPTITEGQVLVGGASGLANGSAGFTFNGSTLALAMGTITTAIGPQTWTETRNAAGVTFPGLKYTITDTASAGGSLAMQILGGPSGTTNLISVGKSAVAGVEWLAASRINIGTASGAPTLSIAGAGNAYLWSTSTGLTGFWNGVNGASEFILDSKGSFSWTTTQNDATATRDTNLSRISAGVIGAGTGTQGEVDGTFRGLYQSSDGTAGATAGPFTVITAITVKNGLVTSLTGS